MERQDYLATATVMLGTLASTLTGFGREMALAYQFGAGRGADIYLVSFAVPEFAFVILYIVVAPAFIPLFTECRSRAGEIGAWLFGRRVAVALLAFLLAIAVLVVLAAPLFLRWLGPGFDPGEHAQAVRAVRIMSPAIAIMGLATLGGAVLQVYRRFARPALIYAIYNTIFIAVLLGAPLVWLVGRAAWGVTLGAVAALLLQLPLLWRYRPVGPATERGERPALPVGIRDAALLAGPLAAGYAVHHLVLFVDRAMATTLGAGGVATLNYGYRLALVVGQLSGFAVSTALFPRMAEQAAQGDRAGLGASLAGALRFVWMIGLPASVGLILLREPLVQVLFERGAFDSAATEAVSEVLVWYAVAVLADALCQPLWRVLYARRSAWTVLAVNGLQTVIRILCNIALIASFGYNGLSFSAAVGLTVQVVVLSLLARRYLGSYLTGAWWRSAARVVMATALAAAVAGLVAGQMTALPAWVVVLTGGSLGGLTYLAGLRILTRVV